MAWGIVSVALHFLTHESYGYVTLLEGVRYSDQHKLRYMMECMPNIILVSPYGALTTIEICSSAARYIRLTSLIKLFSAVGLQTNFLRVWGDNFGGLKPVCAYNRWD